MKQKLYLLMALLGIVIVLALTIYIHQPGDISSALDALSTQHYEQLYQNADLIYQNQMPLETHTIIFETYCKGLSQVKAKKTKQGWRILAINELGQNVNLTFVNRKHHQQLATIEVHMDQAHELKLEALKSLSESYTAAKALSIALLERDYPEAMAHADAKFVKDESALRAFSRENLEGAFLFNTMPQTPSPLAWVDNKHYQINVDIQSVQKQSISTIALLFDKSNPLLVVGIQHISPQSIKSSQAVLTSTTLTSTAFTLPDGLKNQIRTEFTKANQDIGNTYLQTKVTDDGVYVKCVGTQTQKDGQYATISDYVVTPTGTLNPLGTYAFKVQATNKSDIRPECNRLVLQKTKPKVASGILTWYKTIYSQEMGIYVDHYYQQSAPNKQPTQIYVVLRDTKNNVIRTIPQKYHYANYTFI